MSINDIAHEWKTRALDAERLLAAERQRANVNHSLFRELKRRNERLETALREVMSEHAKEGQCVCASCTISWDALNPTGKAEPAQIKHRNISCDDTGKPIGQPKGQTDTERPIDGTGKAEP